MAEPTKENQQEQEQEQEQEKEEQKAGSLFSPEGVLMLTLAIILDGLSIICVILILAFGIGLVLAKIVYVFGLIFIGGWAFLRPGTMPGKGKAKDKMTQGLTRFLKRHSKKLAGKLIPVVGDALPLWTWTVYSELKS